MSICIHCRETVEPRTGEDDKLLEQMFGKKEAPDLPLDQRCCNWCKKGDWWMSEWEYVNSRRWYHGPCIRLMDMVS